MNALPGVFYMYLTDLLSTARIGLEGEIGEPLPGRVTLRPDASESNKADLLREQLALSPEANAHLIRVEVRDGVVYFEGRTPDVSCGVMATRIALAVLPGCRVVNRLAVQA